jgi:glucokinase
MIVLAGDIGGTNTRLGLFSSEKGVSTSIREMVYPSHEYKSLEEVLREFLSENHQPISAAAFVLAGPIDENEVYVTNLGWKTKVSNLRKLLGDIPIVFRNDLSGLSNYIPVIDQTELIRLNQGVRYENGSIAVIAPGTGLGEGFLVWSKNRYQVQPSEGGHASFSPVTDNQVELLKFMQGRYPHVSFERVCSGSAIPDLYEFIKTGGNHEEPEWLRAKLSQAEDQTPVIIQAALDPEKPVGICVAVVDLFIENLAVEAGNMALNTMARGGVYLAGGISAKIAPQLQKNFIKLFTNKGRFSEFLSSIPVYLVVHPQPALFGAAMFAFDLIGVEIH